jgi:hypothetical protein
LSEASVPPLSVVIAPVRGGAGLPGALDALACQEAAPPFEVIVPVDASVVGIEPLRERYPEARFLLVEGTAELAASADPGVAHLAIDRRRAVGLAAAQGEIVALTDECARPRPGWCAGIVAAHAEGGDVIGGAVANDRDRNVNHALFFMDAGRYQAPVPKGDAAFVSDVNVSYARAALESTDAWRESYHETGLHDALRRSGHRLRLADGLELGLDRGAISLGDALAERFAWARLYAGRRCAELAGTRRLVLAAASPLIGPLFLFRQVSLALRRGRHTGALWRCLPILALFDLVWSVGELVGYGTGRATREG